MTKEKVIIILCDTLRAKSLSHYGNERNTTPHLNATIDREFTVYSRAYAPSSWTPPSHMSLFTGLYPSQVMEPGKSLELNPIFKTLPELFNDSGYKTCAFSANELISKNFGYGKGCDIFMQLWLPDPRDEEVILRLKGSNDFDRLVKACKMLISHENRVEILDTLRIKMYKRYRSVLKDATPSTKRTMKMLKKFLSENSDQKVFCFVNLMQVHNTYNPPPATRNTFVKNNAEYEKYFKEKAPIEHYAVEPFPAEIIEYMKLRYEEEILYLDLELSDFIAYLKANSLYDSCTLIVTSDHGEHFGEHGHIAHAFSLFEPLIRIPLYIKWFGKELNKHRIEKRLAMLQDLYSTFIGILGHWHPCPDSSVDLTSADRRSWILSQLPDMSSTIQAARKRRETFSISELGLEQESLQAVVFRSGHKIIQNGNRRWSFNLEIDIDELNPVAPEVELISKIETLEKNIA